MLRAGWLGFVFAGLMAGSVVSAFAQDNVMKICGDKWRIAKESSATSGQTWTQFLAKCRTETAAIVAPAAPAKPVVSIAETPAPASENPAVASAPGKPAVYPGAIAAKFASEKPYRARQKTCSEQYQANKARGDNGGQRWLEKGGGYWSECNKRLKQTRA